MSNTSAAPARVDIRYGRYRIIAGLLKSKPTAFVYLGNEKILHVEGKTVDEAVANSRAELDQHNQTLAAGRRRPDVPTAEEFKEAFRVVPISKQRGRMLRAHLNAADNALTPAELARAAGYRKDNSAVLHYDNLGRAIGEYLGVEPTARNQAGRPAWSHLLAEEVADGERRWRLHPEVVEALREVEIA